MKHAHTVGILALLIASAAAVRSEETAVVVEETSPARVLVVSEIPEPYEPPFWGKALGVVTTVNHYLEGYLEIGLRSTHFTLVDKKKDETINGQRTGFLGSINELEEEQDYNPYPYFRVFPIPQFQYIGIEVGYDKVRAITRKWTDPPPGGSRDKDSDGTIDLRGPSIQLVARYHDWKWLVPYVSVGYVYYQAEFDHEEWWHMGFGYYSDPAYYDWVNAGRPGDPNGGYRRVITTEDDTQGTIYAAGVSAKIWKGIQVEADVRYVEADIEANYSQTWRQGTVVVNNGDYTFPMSTWGYRLSLKYLF